MQTDPLDKLKRIPWSIGAIEQLLPRGSAEREAVRVLHNSVKHEIEWSVEVLEAERKRRGDAR